MTVAVFVACGLHVQAGRGHSGTLRDERTGAATGHGVGQERRAGDHAGADMDVQGVGRVDRAGHADRSSVVTWTLADEPSDADVWSDVCAVGSATLAEIAPAPTSTVSTLGVFVEVEVTFSVGAVTWLFTAAEVSPGVPPIDSVPIVIAEKVAPPMSVLLYMAWPLIAAPRADDRDDVIAWCCCSPAPGRCPWH